MSNTNNHDAKLLGTGYPKGRTFWANTCRTRVGVKFTHKLGC